jgi:hypothetical protein
MADGRARRCERAFKIEALERMAAGENVSALSRAQDRPADGRRHRFSSRCPRSELGGRSSPGPFGQARRALACDAFQPLLPRYGPETLTEQVTSQRTSQPCSG